MVASSAWKRGPKEKRSVLPLVTDGEGFFGRSPNPFPSILSFFSAAADVEVSMAGVKRSGKKRSEGAQKQLLIVNEWSEHTRSRPEKRGALI